MFPNWPQYFAVMSGGLSENLYVILMNFRPSINTFEGSKFFNSTLTLAPTLVVSQAAYPHHEKRIALTLQPMLIFGNKIVSSICWSRGDLRRPEQNIFDVFSRTSGSTELAGPNWTGNGVNPILLLQKMNIGVGFIVWPWSLWPWRISCCQPLWPSWPYCVSRMTGR